MELREDPQPLFPVYDLIIIGGGIVGLAVAQRSLARRPGSSVLLLERSAAICTQQTGRNSGVLHSGLYYEPGSLKARNCRLGKRLMEEFCASAGVPTRRCGKVLVATAEEQLGRLAELEQRGRQNGVEVRRLTPKELRVLEPGVRGCAALHVPETGVVDFAQVGRALAEVFREAGGELRLGATVSAVHRVGPSAEVAVGSELLRARRVVVCAGLEADRLARRAGLARGLRVIPFRGSYRTLLAPYADQVAGLVYPVPDPRFPFLGVHLTRRIDGTVEAGPSAFLSLARTQLSPLRDFLDSISWPGLWRLALAHPGLALGEFSRAASTERFAREARELLPGLEPSALGPAAPGTRAQLLDRKGRLVDDFTFERDGSVLHLLNAPSPAATSSLAIAGRLLDEVGLEAEHSAGGNRARSR